MTAETVMAAEKPKTVSTTITPDSATATEKATTSGKAMNADEAKAILERWGSRARGSQEAHYLVATRYSARQAFVSVGLVVLTAFTGSALFATLSNQDSTFKLALAILSVFSAALAGFDRSQRFLENAEKNRQAGASWNNVVHQTELLWEQLPAHPPTEAQITAIGNEMDDVTSKSPQIPEKLFTKCGIDKTYVFHEPYTGRLSRPAPATTAEDPAKATTG